jgi:hypothetical protein
VGRAALTGENPDQDYISGVPTGIYGIALSPLDTTIVAGPPGVTTSSAARFEFTASEPAGFECSLEGAPFAPCSSPLPLESLGEGRHSFQVRAAGAGSTDPTPAERTWTVDRTRPRVRRLRLSRTRFAAGARTKIRYRLSEHADVRFTVRRRSGRRLRGRITEPSLAGRNSLLWGGRIGGRRLRPGRYVLVASATDLAKNRSRPARARFSIRPRS